MVLVFLNFQYFLKTQELPELLLHNPDTGSGVFLSPFRHQIGLRPRWICA